MTVLTSMLLASPHPEVLHAWYAEGLEPTATAVMDEGYRVLTFGTFHVLIDQRDDVTGRNADPGRVILNLEVDDARTVADRLTGMGSAWLAELEDRDGSLFGTVIDPDGNYVQIIQLSAAHRAAMAEGPAPADVDV